MDNCQRGRYTIAIMIGDTQSDYSEELLRGFYTCAREENVNLIFLMGPQIPQYCMDILACNLEGNYNYQFSTIYDYVSFAKADALIIAYGSVATFYNIEDKKKFLQHYAKIPHVILEVVSEDAPYLIADNYNGMRKCMEHLVVHHGYRKIAFLGGPKVNRDSNERFVAYRDVMQEHGIEITESMIVYGNFTERVEREVNELLDHNPGLEAIVCANDTMAKCCYRVCQSRNLQIGKDIAITGFDGVEFSRLMTPPLTSVSRSSFKFSYIALKNAIALCEGKESPSYRTPAVMQIRESCGCSMEDMRKQTCVPPENMEQFIVQAAEKIAADVLDGIPYEKEREHYAALVDEYFSYIYQRVFEGETDTLEMDYLLSILKQFADYPHVSSTWLFERFSNLIQIMIDNEQDTNKQKVLFHIVNTSQQYIHSFERMKREKIMNDLNRKAWFVPSFTRDLNRRGKKGDYTEVFIPLMQRLQMMGGKSCYIYLFEQPFVYSSGAEYSFPERIYLTAYYNEKDMVCYLDEERPCVTADNGFASLMLNEKSEILTSFILFSGEKQYGMMLCEVEQEDISFLQICGLQIGSLLRYLEVNWLEQEAQEELKSSLRVIKEKNHILSFISEYDELTKFLNRRGFMEHAISACAQNDGRTAYLIFCDLDHLKEINDTFGHAAGDFAIRSAADRLKSVLPNQAVTARIGGDEFVSLVISDAPTFKDALIAELKYKSEEFNAVTTVPYYVELSVGIYEFSCNPQVEISEIIQKSDELLYEAKKRRRKSICK